MINFNDVTKENMEERNPNWPQFPDYQIILDPEKRIHYLI